MLTSRRPRRDGVGISVWSYIRTTPERLWQAITDLETRARYHFGSRVESDWSPGAAYGLVHAGAPGRLTDGKNLEVDPPRRLVQTLHAHWSEGCTKESNHESTR